MAVYFIRAGEDGPVKIGFASDIGRRLTKMQADNHEALHVLRGIAGDKTTEKQIHLEFSDLRLRGEWFRFDARMLSIGIPIEWQHSKPDLVGLTPLARAIFFVGSRNALATALGIAGSAISQWDRVPAERVLAVEAATDGTVTREELRPDLYPPKTRTAKRR
jgi:DNA-binding transcriptional regulator YdaS (Cro superfamily)